MIWFIHTRIIGRPDRSENTASFASKIWFHFTIIKYAGGCYKHTKYQIKWVLQFFFGLFVFFFSNLCRSYCNTSSGRVSAYFLRTPLMSSHAFCNSSQRLSFKWKTYLSSLFFDSMRICLMVWGPDRSVIFSYSSKCLLPHLVSSVLRKVFILMATNIMMLPL